MGMIETGVFELDYPINQVFIGIELKENGNF